MASRWWQGNEQGKAGMGQFPSSGRCSWCTVQPKSTYCSSKVVAEANHLLMRRQPFLRQNQSTCRPPVASRHCNRRGLTFAGHTEVVSESSDLPRQKRTLPGKTVCRVGPNVWHPLQKYTTRQCLSRCDSLHIIKHGSRKDLAGIRNLRITSFLRKPNSKVSSSHG